MKHGEQIVAHIRSYPLPSGFKQLSPTDVRGLMVKYDRWLVRGIRQAVLFIGPKSVEWDDCLSSRCEGIFGETGE